MYSTCNICLQGWGLSEPEPGSQPLENIAHERYCFARMNGMRVPEAHVEAGFSDKTKQNWKLEKRAEVKARTRWLKIEAASRAVASNAVTRSELIEILRDNIRLAKKGTPILGRDGADSGEVKLDLSSANRGVEILAKMNGFMLDVSVDETSLDSELEGKSEDELRVFLLSLIEQVDPNLRKMLADSLEVEDPGDSVPDGETLQ